MVAHLTSGAEVPGSIAASATMILMRGRIICNKVKNLRADKVNPTPEAKK